MIFYGLHSKEEQKCESSPIAQNWGKIKQKEKEDPGDCIDKLFSIIKSKQILHIL